MWITVLLIGAQKGNSPDEFLADVNNLKRIIIAFLLLLFNDDIHVRFPTCDY